MKKDCTCESICGMTRSHWPHLKLLSQNTCTLIRGPNTGKSPLPPGLLTPGSESHHDSERERERDSCMHTHSPHAAATPTMSHCWKLLPRRAFFPSSAPTLLTALSIPASPGRHNIQLTPQPPFSLKSVSEWFHCLFPGYLMFLSKLCLLKKKQQPETEKNWH